MPTPNESESREEFVERCIPVVINDGTADNSNEAFAICNSIYEQSAKNMKKILNPYEIKTLNLEVKNVNIGSREVEFYASVFNIKDSDNDIIRPGSFTKSILERGPDSSSNRKIGFLRNHDWDRVIGKITKIEEDGYGLLVIGQLGRATDGKDALLDYQDGIIREHSIGFNYVPGKIKLIEGEGEDNYHWEVTEVNLFEVSAVTFGANEFTHVVDVAKGETKESELDKVNNQMIRVIKTIKAGTEEPYNLEMKLKILQTKYNSLINYEPSNLKDTHQDNEPNKRKNVMLNLLK